MGVTEECDVAGTEQHLWELGACPGECSLLSRRVRHVHRAVGGRDSCCCFDRCGSRGRVG